MALHYFNRAIDLLSYHDQGQGYQLLLAREAVHHYLGNRSAQLEDLTTLTEIASSDQQLEVAQRSTKPSRYTAPQGISIRKAHCLSLLAYVEQALGHFQEAQDNYQGALSHYTALGYRQGEAMVLQNLGGLSIVTGDYDLALHHVELSLTIHQQVEHRRGISLAMDKFSQIHFALDQPQSARGYFEQALAISQAIGLRKDESIFLTQLGHVLVALNELDQATLSYSQALELHQTT